MKTLATLELTQEDDGDIQSSLTCEEEMSAVGFCILIQNVISALIETHDRLAEAHGLPRLK